ncbi:MAG: hypothetical protein GC164_03080 [Phycisphaera sp.]|nr:hypothetical protein [Phycisphaera sp.]
MVLMTQPPDSGEALIGRRPERPPILLVAATTLEAQPTLDLLRRRLGPDAVVALVTGIGGERAARILREYLAQHRVTLVVHIGFAGGLDPALRVGETLVVGKVVHPTHGELHCDTHDLRSVLLTVDEVVDSPQRKSELFHKHLAAAVDMEGFFVARQAHDAGVPYLGVRSVSDTSEQTMPAFLAHCVDAHGRPSAWRAFAGMVIRPWQLGNLLRIQRDCAVAVQTLPGAVWLALHTAGHVAG